MDLEPQSAIPDLMNSLAPPPETAEPQQGADPSGDDPNTTTEADALEQAGLTQAQQDGLKQVRELFKKQFAPARGKFVRRCLRAFEVMKNNSYVLYNQSNAAYDTLSEIFAGQATSDSDAELYQYSNNIYQMLALTCIAALSPAVPKCRFQPADADNEDDLSIAQKASTIHAYTERQNKIKALQKLEILYLWCSGSYFAYTRHIIDANRAGVQKIPVYDMQEQEIAPSRYVCPDCGTTTSDESMSPFTQPNCPSCKSPLGQQDWYENQTATLPVKTGEEERPNGMTAMNILNGLHVSVDPEAQDLYESAILDYEIEQNVAAVRAAYPLRYKEIATGSAGAGGASGAGDEARQARQSIQSPGGAAANSNGMNQGTYSRCWIQPWAFYILDDQDVADSLMALFPNGVKLVTFNDVFLQAVPERMMDHWTWCPTLKGFGMYPMGIGDAALDVQERVNDCANTLHAYMDRLAFGTILMDGDVVDVAAFTSRALTPGNVTPVNRKADQEGSSKPLESLLYQPQFHIDGHIFNYEQQLIQLMQMLSGVQPQTYGGSDPNVQTAQGQAQMLKSAMGRMQLFWDQMREEHAARAENSVRCTVLNMDDEMRVVMDGDVTGNYRTETILASEVVGDFMAYPESDEGFPSSYEEVQARILQLLQDQKNPFLQAVLAEPDTQKVVARYVLPDQIKLPGDSERSRIKEIMHLLGKSEPVTAQGPNGPMMMPSILPSDDFDDFGVAVQVATQWLQEQWRAQDQPGFANVLAFLRICKQKAIENAAHQQMAAQAQQGPPPGAAPRKQ